MCGRYNFSAEDAAEIRKIIQEVNDRLNGAPIKTGEIFPTNLVPVLLPEGAGTTAQPMIWGFPHWQKSGVIINARSETVTERKMFRDSVFSRRCVVPSSGFYEWKREQDGKTKYLFRCPGEDALYMAGFWNTYREKDGAEKQRFVILTTGANEWMQETHDRMPVILGPEEREEWLSNDVDFERLFKREHIPLVKSVA